MSASAVAALLLVGTLSRFLRNNNQSGQDGSAGPAGPAGPAGSDGAQGQAGPQGPSLFDSQSFNTNDTYSLVSPYTVI